MNGVIPGCILHWEKFQFADGETANKFLVIAGAKPNCNYLAVVATSKQHHRTFKPGCHADDGYYHIPGGRKDWFPLDTWLLIGEPKELRAADLVRAAMVTKQVEVKGHLREQVANEIRNCIKYCPDVSAEQIKLL